MAPLADAVDTHAVLQVVWSSLVAGIGVTVVYALVIVGATRAAELSRGGNRPGAILFGVVCAVALVAEAAAVAYGIAIMINK